MQLGSAQKTRRKPNSRDSTRDTGAELSARAIPNLGFIHIYVTCIARYSMQRIRRSGRCPTFFPIPVGSSVRSGITCRVFHCFCTTSAWPAGNTCYERFTVLRDNRDIFLARLMSFFFPPGFIPGRDPPSRCASEYLYPLLFEFEHT